MLFTNEDWIGQCHATGTKKKKKEEEEEKEKGGADKDMCVPRAR